MVTYLLKKSYQLKSLKEIPFKDLWGDHGIFTTMWIYGKPPKILFFKNHIDNLIKSLKKYGIKKKFIRRDILEIINRNISLRNNYNHLLRVALNNKIISISLRKRVSPKLNFHLKFINFKREKPKYKNLKYKKILSYLSKMDNSSSDVALVFNKKKFLRLELQISYLLKIIKYLLLIEIIMKVILINFLKAKLKRLLKKIF